MSPQSKAHIKASRKYNEKAYDRINLTIMKGQKVELKKHAEEQAESLNGFICRAIIETIARDNERKQTNK